MPDNHDDFAWILHGQHPMCCCRSEPQRMLMYPYPFSKAAWARSRWAAMSTVMLYGQHQLL